MSLSEPRSARFCNDCRIVSPETETEFTLISAQHGWRLSRVFGNDGKVTLEWRCPKCWQAFKQRRLLTQTPLDGVPASSSRGGAFPEDEPPSSTRSGPRSRR